MPENSHRQKYNGFSFAFRLTRRTSDHRKETEKDGFSSEKRTLMQEKKRILRFDWHSRHFARMKKLSSFGDIIKWRKKNRNLETNLDFVILQGRRNFAHFPTNFHKEWKNMETNRDFRNQLWRHQHQTPCWLYSSQCHRLHRHSDSSARRINNYSSSISNVFFLSDFNNTDNLGECNSAFQRTR